MEGPVLTFLGTGTSLGVPIAGCDCKVCRSADPRDKRMRSSVLVEWDGLRILVDAGPDFRMQMIGADVKHLDAIFLTHNHKDHTGGLDDTRSLNFIDKRAVEIYCENKVLGDLQEQYKYAFADPKYPGAPVWRIHTISQDPFLVPPDEGHELAWIHDVGYAYRLPDSSLLPCGNYISEARPAPSDAVRAILSGEGCRCSDYGGAVIIPIRGLHDKLPVLGFRFGNIAYITDMSSIPESEFEKLRGLKHVTLNTVSYNRHHSHFSLDEALDLSARIGAQHTWLTHLSHTFPVHEEFCRELKSLCAAKSIPQTVQPAYDGLRIY